MISGLKAVTFSGVKRDEGRELVKLEEIRPLLCPMLKCSQDRPRNSELQMT